MIINGVEVPYDASLYWLILNMSSVDNFLYLTLIVPNLEYLVFNP